MGFTRHSYMIIETGWLTGKSVILRFESVMVDITWLVHALSI